MAIRMGFVFGFILVALVSSMSFGAPNPASQAPVNKGAETMLPTTPAPAAGKVKYKAAKDMNFEELLIEGQLKRPDLNVITGETEQGGNGLLRLRENFVDRMTADAGEEAQ